MKNTITPVLSLAAALMLIGGCHDSNSVKKDIDKSNTKISALKSGVEWQQAQSQFNAGDLDKALNSINKSLAINPDVAKSHVLKGRIVLEMGDPDVAAACLNRAIELDPASAEAPYYLGIIAERNRQPEIALGHYQSAAKLDRSNPQYVIASAEMLTQLKRDSEAEKLLLDVPPSLSHAPGIRHTLGQICVLRGQPDKAVVYFSEAHLLAPENMTILEDLATAQVASGQYADAEYNLGKLLKDAKRTGRRDLVTMRARCLAEMDRLVDARSLLLELTSSDAGSNDVQAWVQLGNVCARLSDHARLRPIASRLVALAPRRWEGYAFRGMHAQSQQNFSVALEAFDRAVAFAGDDVMPLVLKALCQSDMGQGEQARRTIADAVGRDPSCVPAQQVQTLLLQGPQAVTSHPDAQP